MHVALYRKYVGTFKRWGICDRHIRPQQRQRPQAWKALNADSPAALTPQRGLPQPQSYGAHEAGLASTLCRAPKAAHTDAPQAANTLTLYVALRARQRSRGTLTRYAQLRAVHMHAGQFSHA